MAARVTPVLELVKNGDPAPKPAPALPPAVTAAVALICAAKFAPQARNVIVIAEGDDGSVTVTHSTMPEAEGLDLAAQGVRLLGMSLKADARD